MVAIARTVPDTPTRDQIATVAPAIPRLGEAATALQAWTSDEDLYRLFTGIAWYWQGQGAYGQAQPWEEQCLAVVRGCLGEGHPHVASSLHNLAHLYLNQGRYREAEPLFKQALQIAEQRLGLKHPRTVLFRNNLALLRSQQTEDGGTGIEGGRRRNKGGETGAEA